MAKIPYGCILLARKIKHSDIWLKKPSWWLKVWEYILMEVNHANKEFPRGQNFFTREQIHTNCHLGRDKVKVASVDNVIRWLRMQKSSRNCVDGKSTTQITTQKTTRGIIITVCNYNTYQNIKSYKNDTTNETVDETKTTQKRDRNDTITKECKECNNVNKEIYKEKGLLREKRFNEIWAKYPKRDGRKSAYKHFLASVVNDKDWQDINIALENYFKCESFKNGFIKNGSTWFNQWRDFIDFVEPIKPSNKPQQPKKIVGLADRRI